MSIQSRLPRAEYDAIQAISISRLKELRRSPQHYQYALTHPKESDALTLGIATHVAVLEPERFERDFAIWDRITEGGAMAPRRGQHWDAFQLANMGKSLLTPAEGKTAKEIAAAVHSSPLAMKYLERGESEVSMEWTHDTRKCKGRIDWLTSVDGHPVVVGLKTARDCRHFIFGAQAARLGYHLQWAWYAHAYVVSTSASKLRMVEIVVENEPPYAVAVYNIPKDIIELGRDEYTRLLETLTMCERTGEWPGPCEHEEDLTLPTWAYPQDGDDITDLGLE